MQTSHPLSRTHFSTSQTTAIAFSILSLVPAVQPMYDSLFARAKAYKASRYDGPGHANKPQEMPLLASTPLQPPPDQGQQTHSTPPSSSGPPLPTPGSAYFDQNQTRPTADHSPNDNNFSYVPPVWQPSHGTGYGPPSNSNPSWAYSGV